jgi:ParB-like chromosome segregation protein Spo0J
MKRDNPGNKKAAERLKVVYRRIEELKLDPGNPRLHSARHIRQIAQSIETFGMIAPILIDRTDTVVAGHGRVLACQQLGRMEVPTIALEHLTDSQAKAYLIADNRLAENSEWDERLLAEQLKQLSELKLDFALDVTGFEIGEIDLRIEELSTASEKDEARADAVPDPQTNKPVTRLGDIWILNDHK